MARQGRERLMEIRVHGDAESPALIFLPGLHGDWTLIGPLRRALSSRVRFVEMTYPRTTSWTLGDHAREAKAALLGAGVESGWLLAESFGSQVAWPLVEQAAPELEFKGLILAGGFVRHPWPWSVRLARRVGAKLPLPSLEGLARRFAARLRRRHRRDEIFTAELEEFIARRTEDDRSAALHRLELIARADPRSIASAVQTPVHMLHGRCDFVVWGPPVQRWLRRHCPGWSGTRLLWQDHPLLVTAPGACAEAIRSWMGGGGRPNLHS